MESFKAGGKYRKKPIVIDAMQYTGDNHEQIVVWAAFTSGQACFGVSDKNEIEIETLEGKMTASIGDWLIIGVKGEMYPCKPDIFEATYEPVSEEKPKVCDVIEPDQTKPYPIKEKAIAYQKEGQAAEVAQIGN